MPEHMTEWLGAYLDGELNSYRQGLVQAHLRACETCHAELESLVNLSSLLQQAPAPEFSPAKRFAAQVGLRLPRRPAAPGRDKLMETGWWLIPVGLAALWMLVSASFLTSDLLSAAHRWGMLGSASDWLVLRSLTLDSWSATLSQFGLLRGDNLGWLAATEEITRTSLLQLTFQASIAMLYLSWIAIWWARRWHEGHGQILER
jgi:predicted anti-sigma-YlaC factor YlaD